MISNFHTCKTKKSCRTNLDCADGWCCTSDILPSTHEEYGKRKSEGTAINYNGKSYLCDPLNGFISSENQIGSLTKKQINLIDVIIDIFSKIFS